MQEDEPTAFVTYEKFEKKMLDIMIAGEYKPDIDDTLRQAFLVSKSALLYCKLRH